VTPEQLWAYLPFAYLFTILIETPVLLVGLSARHPTSRRLFAGAWLTACTFPVVTLVFTAVFDSPDQRLAYLIVAETFAPAGECFLFWLAFLRDLPPDRRSSVRDYVAIVVANLASFGAGEVMNAANMWERLGVI
jgi:hypothetical protein